MTTLLYCPHLPLLHPWTQVFGEESVAAWPRHPSRQAGVPTGWGSTQLVIQSLSLRTCHCSILHMGKLHMEKERQLTCSQPHTN